MENQPTNQLQLFLNTNDGNVLAFVCKYRVFFHNVFPALEYLSTIYRLHVFNHMVSRQNVMFVKYDAGSSHGLAISILARYVKNPNPTQVIYEFGPECRSEPENTFTP